MTYSAAIAMTTMNQSEKWGQLRCLLFRTVDYGCGGLRTHQGQLWDRRLMLNAVEWVTRYIEEGVRKVTKGQSDYCVV